MVFYAFAAVLVCWMIWAYKAAFGVQMLPFVGMFIRQFSKIGANMNLGRPGPAMSMDYELQQSTLPSYGPTGAQQAFPQATMVYFQFVFAAITLVITAGSFLCRMSFIAWMIYVPLWLTLSYTVVAFSIWGGGFLTKLGVLDYSGG
jgi:Amt family ammonium transporter